MPKYTRVADPHEAVAGHADVEQGDAPAGADHAGELGEERRQVDEVAQGEPARHAVDAAVGDREAQDVGLDPRRSAAVGAQHPEAEVDRDRLRWPAAARSTHRSPVPLARSSTLLPAGNASAVDCVAPPAHVEAERHHPVDEVVARGDGVEHLAHGPDLLVALRQ